MQISSQTSFLLAFLYFFWVLGFFFFCTWTISKTVVLYISVPFTCKQYLTITISKRNYYFRTDHREQFRGTNYNQLPPYKKQTSFLHHPSAFFAFQYWFSMKKEINQQKLTNRIQNMRYVNHQHPVNTERGHSIKDQKLWYGWSDFDQIHCNLAHSIVLGYI